LFKLQLELARFFETQCRRICTAPKWPKSEKKWGNFS